MHDTAFHVLIVDGGLTQNHSFVAIVSQRTDFAPRPFWTNQSAHTAIVAFPVSLPHVTMYIVRVVSAVRHARCVQCITKLHSPKDLPLSTPPGLEPPVIASLPTELASKPVNMLSFVAIEKVKKRKTEDPIEIESVVKSSDIPDLTSRLPQSRRDRSAPRLRNPVTHSLVQSRLGF